MRNNWFALYKIDNVGNTLDQSALVCADVFNDGIRIRKIAIRFSGCKYCMPWYMVWVAVAACSQC